MSGRTWKRLVVDASVLRSAGSEAAVAPASTNCRDVLMQIRDSRHKLVVTVELQAEWKRHASRFAAAWILDMLKRDRATILGSVAADDEIQALPDQCNSVNKSEAVAKDLHLVIAALTTDKSVLSCDTTARRCFCELVEACSRLGAILWLDPVSEFDETITWLKDGAKRVKAYQLATRAKQ
jgi:hypothetical protein